MLLDTGSYMSWVPSPDCPRSKCPGSHFETSLSDTFVDYSIPQELSYGTGKLHGKLVSDDVWSDQVNPTHPHAVVNFMLVEDAQNMDNLKSDGLIGLSPEIRDEDPNSHESDSLIQKFYESGSIDKKMFSLYLGDDYG